MVMLDVTDCLHRLHPSPESCCTFPRTVISYRSPVYEKEAILSSLLTNISGLLQLAHTTDGCGQGACCWVCVYAYVLGGVPEWHGSLFYFKLNKYSWMLYSVRWETSQKLADILLFLVLQLILHFWKDFSAPDMYQYMVKLRCSSSQIWC